MDDTTKSLLIAYFNSPTKTIKSLLDLEHELSTIKPCNDGLRRIINAIKGFNLHRTAQEYLHEPLTNKQWTSIFHIIVRYYGKQSLLDWGFPEVAIPPPQKNKSEDGRTLPQPLSNKYSLVIPSTLPRINMFQLPSEGLMLVSNLFEELSKPGLDSNLTMPILNYYALLEILRAEFPTLPELLEPVDKLLIGHGWTPSGFIASPNCKELVQDLHFLINTL